MNSPDPGERIHAIVTAGEQGRQEAVPLLVDRLEDEDTAVRFFAIQSLEKITGQTKGYRYYDPPGLRARAVRRWRSWVEARTVVATSQAAQMN